MITITEPKRKYKLIAHGYRFDGVQDSKEKRFKAETIAVAMVWAAEWTIAWYAPNKIIKIEVEQLS